MSFFFWKVNGKNEWVFNIEIKARIKVGGTVELHYFHNDDCVAPIIIVIYSYLYSIVFYCDSSGHLLVFKNLHTRQLALIGTFPDPLTS